MGSDKHHEKIIHSRISKTKTLKKIKLWIKMQIKVKSNKFIPFKKLSSKWNCMWDEYACKWQKVESPIVKGTF